MIFLAHQLGRIVLDSIPIPLLDLPLHFEEL